MLSPVSRGLTYGMALYYFVLGVVLFFIPGHMSGVFAWNVSPFVAMTIGAWCLGNSWMALVTGWRWRWSQVYASLVYLWAFGLLQSVVALSFHDKLRLAHPIAWLYLGTLAFSLLAAFIGMIDLLRLRPAREPLGEPVNRVAQLVNLIFVILVGFLGIYGLVAQTGWPATNAGVFPEVLSLFTLKSFGAFYLSLVIGATALLRDRYLAARLHYIFAAFGLIVMITLAALWYIEQFDFANRPGGLVYIGIYLVVGLISVVYFVIYGTGRISAQNENVE
ncbi:MAG: hypothetical protein A2Z16_05525 [Chloroflexi bacterium RBG_16_54_18]|nr:MAG: hypothetical protein A2Z16_05525 [Chloroflexi bacterium RBG_16_54_18]